ncbi:MAG: hypothetical protein ABIO70_07095 [Pseudomonadota bacterium]
MAQQRRRLPLAEQGGPSTPAAAQPLRVQPARDPRQAEQETAPAAQQAGPIAQAPAVAGRSTGPVQLDAAEAGEEGAVAEAAGAEVESAAAGHGGGFFGWVGSLLGWGERGAIRYDDTMRGGDPEALHGHATTIDTTFDEKGRVARQGQESHDIAGGSATDRHSVEFSGRAKGDHEHLDIHGDLGGTRRSTTTVEDAAGRHVDSVEVGGKVEGDMDRKKGEAAALAGRGTLQVAATQADTAGGTTVTTREGGKLTGGMARDAEGKLSGDVSGEANAGIERKSTEQVGDTRIADTVGASGKAGGRYQRRGGGHEGSGSLDVGASGERVATTVRGDTTHTDTVGADVGLEGEVGSAREGVRTMGSLQGGVHGEQRDKVVQADGHTVTTATKERVAAHGDLEREGGKTTGSGGVQGSAGWSREDAWREGAVEHKETLGVAGDAALDHKAGTTTTRGGLSVTRGAQTVREDAAGRTITAKQADTVGVKADVARGEKPGQGVSASWQRKDTEVVEQVAQDGAKRKTTTEHVGRQVEAGYRQGQGASASFSTGNVHHDEQTRADGTKVASHHEDKTTLSADAKGVGVSHSVSGVGREETRRLDDKTTLTTTQGKVGGTAGARAEKGEDGTWAATAKAEGNATLYEQRVDRKLENGGKASAGWEALSAKGQAEAKANISKDGVKIGGNAGAKATLIGGNAMIEAPVFGWKMLGEEVDVAVTAGVSAGVLAEASGQVDLDISKGDSLGVQMSGGGKAFAGAKAGVEVGAKLRWKRQPDYTDLVVGFAKSLPGAVDDWLVDKVPRDVWGQVAQILIGSGTTDLVTGKAGAEASAGVGGEASFGLTLKGGKINVSGALSGTVGLGAGVHTDLLLDAVDGVRFAGVLAMRGTAWLKDAISQAGDWFDQAVDVVQAKIDEYMEAEKAQGGFSGAAATVVDFFGDSVFGLW